MIRNWLRSWLGITAIETRKVLDTELTERVAKLERELVEQESAHGAEMQELRDRLDMPAKRKPSGRPFAVLAKLAAMGAEKQNAG